jgi:uncharacterized protein (UPF0332 family)
MSRSRARINGGAVPPKLIERGKCTRSAWLSANSISVTLEIRYRLYEIDSLVSPTSKRSASKRLLRVAKADAALIRSWGEGISLANDSGLTVPDLLLKAAIARYRLAAAHRSHALKLMGLNPPSFRAAVSRFYYSMYTGMRAAAFVYYKGDDHNSHSALPTKIPDDFPAANWQTRLKDARLARNMADYDPYPFADTAWRSEANRMRQDADELISSVRSYLKAKGCRL